MARAALLPPHALDNDNTQQVELVGQAGKEATPPRMDQCRGEVLEFVAISRKEHAHNRLQLDDGNRCASTFE